MLREERDSLSSEQSLVQIHAAPARFDAIRVRHGRLEKYSVTVSASAESVGSIQIDAVSRCYVGGRNCGSTLLRADIKSIAAPRRSSLRHWNGRCAPEHDPESGNRFSEKDHAQTKGQTLDSTLIGSWSGSASSCKFRRSVNRSPK